MAQARETDAPSEEEALVDTLVARARAAQAEFESGADQARYDNAAMAAAWALMEPGRNRELAQMAVETTGLGNVADKILKNHRKTLGLLRDIKPVPTHGVVREEPDRGLTVIARPIGVIAAIVPSTNPVATPVNNAVNALKCGNAIILAPSPKGVRVCEKLIGYIHAEFDKMGLPHDLVQMLPAPASKVKTQRLMETSDLLVVTGSQDNVRRAYSSGTPAVGVGAGNVSVIVDETAELKAAAAKITASKTFDNATSCSSENALVIVDEVHDAMVQALHDAGGRLLDDVQAKKLKLALFQNGGLNRKIIARDIGEVISEAGLSVEDADNARFLMIPGKEIGPDHPESGEKLSLVTTIYRARDYDDAVSVATRLLHHQGAGHSIGIHTLRDDRAIGLGKSLPTCRVIVNQPHCFATGGSFENGMPFSLSMGCGSWGGNSIDENLNYSHFMNLTKIVRPIPVSEPTVEDVLGAYWELVGK
ncbi:aldehyde dehydrogenase family protein [Sulfitobacter aestuarii]|uniref:Aldehyde dehydrogenase family protein n=1 Tax=Sulfitobacter aestuarii TaxID=2161676 RepID=A0ABW5U779_9RHOB